MSDDEKWLDHDTDEDSQWHPGHSDASSSSAASLASGDEKELASSSDSSDTRRCRQIKRKRRKRFRQKYVWLSCLEGWSGDRSGRFFYHSRYEESRKSSSDDEESFLPKADDQYATEGDDQDDAPSLSTTKQLSRRDRLLERRSRTAMNWWETGNKKRVKVREVFKCQTKGGMSSDTFFFL